ncbi:MAG: plastocyanin/azurin family copper-binding protein [Solirubrobacteraceae bacterium]
MRFLEERRRPLSAPGGSLHALATRTAFLAFAGVVAISVSGCAVKGADNANLIVGKQAFVAKCGSCHTMARAETKGIVGPNLDEVFRASVAEGLQRNAVRTVVEGQVQNPNPEGVMPKGLASGATLSDIAAYVEQSVDQPGKDTGLLASAVQAPGAGKPVVEKAGKLEIDASPSGQLAYTTDKAEAKPGSVTIVMGNMSGVMHNIAIEAGEGGATGKGAPIAASQFITKGTTSVTVNLKPGKYTFFCQAPGHRGAGMYGTVTVK